MIKGVSKFLYILKIINHNKQSAPGGSVRFYKIVSMML